MASKKDKFSKAARSHLKGAKPGMEGFVKQVEEDVREEEREGQKTREVKGGRSRDKGEADIAASENKPASDASDRNIIEGAPYSESDDESTERAGVPIGASRPGDEEIDLPQGRRARKANGRGQREDSDMARSRDSIYNVSSDIRLEDYTEAAPRQRNLGAAARMIGGLLLIALIVYGIYALSGSLFRPEYRLAVANHEIDESAMVGLAAQDRATVSAMENVYVRFQWEEGQLQTDYVKIRIERISGANITEEAVLGRRVPDTANYIYFVGPLDFGNYRVLVMDRAETILATKELSVR